MLPTTLDGWRQLTGGFFVAWVLSAMAYTAFARILGGNDATLSVSVGQWAKAWPVIAFGAGFVAGHVFWPVR